MHCSVWHLLTFVRSNWKLNFRGWYGVNLKRFHWVKICSNPCFSCSSEFVCFQDGLWWLFGSWIASFWQNLVWYWGYCSVERISQKWLALGKCLRHWCLGKLFCLRLIPELHQVFEWNFFTIVETLYYL